MPWLRVYKRSVAQVSETEYLLTLELGTNSIPSEPVPATPDVETFAIGGQGDRPRDCELHYSDDGSSWTTLFTSADMDAAPGGATSLYLTVPGGQTRHRYWRLAFIQDHPGGFFGGISIKWMRLVSAAGVDRLHLAGGSAPDWQADQPNSYVGDIIPFTATSNIANLRNACNFADQFPGPVVGNQECDWGVTASVPPPGTYSAYWVFDVSAG